MSKQTAVDYLFEKLCGENGYVDTYYMDVIKKIEAIYEEAKVMEREQILNAYREGRTDQQAGRDEYFNRTSVQYYNETYKGGEQ